MEKSSLIEDEETVQRFFVAPGMEFKEAQAARAAVIYNKSCFVVPDIVFLAVLSKEYIRRERVLANALPSIFKVAFLGFSPSC